jgi:hypothetical protein
MTIIVADVGQRDVLQHANWLHYRDYHLRRERQRIHDARYLDPYVLAA